MHLLSLRQEHKVNQYDLAEQYFASSPQKLKQNQELDYRKKAEFREEQT